MGGRQARCNDGNLQMEKAADNLGASQGAVDTLPLDGE